jgi:hypothetical protein
VVRVEETEHEPAHANHSGRAEGLVSASPVLAEKTWSLVRYDIVQTSETPSTATGDENVWATGVGAALRGRRQYREKYAASWRSAPASA